MTRRLRCRRGTQERPPLTYKQRNKSKCRAREARRKELEREKAESGYNADMSGGKGLHPHSPRSDMDTREYVENMYIFSDLFR